MARCGLRCSDSVRHALPNSKFAVNAIVVRQRVRRVARIAYEQKLRRTLDRHFPEFKVTKLTTGVDLEKSFGPVYARGLMRRGRSAFALLGVNAQETQSSIDAALTFGILWLDVCRQRAVGKRTRGRPETIRSEWNLGAGAGEDGKSEPRCSEVVAI